MVARPGVRFSPIAPHFKFIKLDISPRQSLLACKLLIGAGLSLCLAGRRLTSVSDGWYTNAPLLIARRLCPRGSSRIHFLQRQFARVNIGPERAFVNLSHFLFAADASCGDARTLVSASAGPFRVSAKLSPTRKPSKQSATRAQAMRQHPDIDAGRQIACPELPPENDACKLMPPALPRVYLKLFWSRSFWMHFSSTPCQIALAGRSPRLSWRKRNIVPSLTTKTARRSRARPSYGEADLVAEPTGRRERAFAAVSRARKSADSAKNRFTSFQT